MAARRTIIPISAAVILPGTPGSPSATGAAAAPAGGTPEGRAQGRAASFVGTLRAALAQATGAVATPNPPAGLVPTAQPDPPATVAPASGPSDDLALLLSDGTNSDGTNLALMAKVFVTSADDAIPVVRSRASGAKNIVAAKGTAVPPKAALDRAAAASVPLIAATPMIVLPPVLPSLPTPTGGDVAPAAKPVRPGAAQGLAAPLQTATATAARPPVLEGGDPAALQPAPLADGPSATPSIGSAVAPVVSGMTAPPAVRAGSAPATDAPADLKEANPPARQLVPALIAISAVGPNTQRLIVRLDPAELGQVEIRIDRPASGPPEVRIAVERRETLSLLQHDHRLLQQALDQAGIPPEGRQIEFRLVPRIDAGNGAPAWAAGDTGGGGQNGFGANDRPAGRGQGGQPETRDSALLPDGATGVPGWLRAGVNITA